MRSRVVLFVALATIFLFGKPVSSKVGNYEYYAGVGYYRYVSAANAMTFNAAFDNCVSDGGHLVIINDENEAKVVKELQSQEESGTGNWWTGIEYYFGSWRDIKGNSIESTGYVKWAPGQPEDGNKEPCLVTKADAEYHDYRCDKEFPFICEIEIFK